MICCTEDIENIDDLVLGEIRQVAAGIIEGQAGRIAAMTNEERAQYRIIQSKRRLHLVPKNDPGIPIKEWMKSTAIPRGLENARIFQTKDGEQIIAYVLE